MYRIMINDGNFAQAFWLCNESLAWTEDSAALRVVEQLKSGTTAKYQEIGSHLQLALQASCADFVPEGYVKVAEPSVHWPGN